MTLCIQLILIALVCTGVSDFLYKRAQSSGISVGKFMTLQSATFFSVQLGCCALFGFHYDPDLLILGLVGGIIAFASFSLLYHSMRDGEASVNAMIFRMSFIVTSAICVAVFGEAVTLNKVLGTTGAIGAIALISLAPGSRFTGIGLPILAALCFGFLRFLHKGAGLIGVSPWSLLVIQSGVFQICAQIVRGRESLRGISRATFLYAPACGLLLSGATIACIFAFRTGDASSLVPITQLGFLVTMPLAVLLLHERVGMRKLAALSLAAGSALVLLV